MQFILVYKLKNFEILELLKSDNLTDKIQITVIFDTLFFWIT